MNGVEKIVEGMKLIKEGCSEIPVGTYNCGKSTCPFGWLCYGEEIVPLFYGEEIVPPEDWHIPMPWDK